MTIISTINPTAGDEFGIFPLPHNWGRSFTTGYEFKTDITVSGNGKEQRSAVRWWPRVDFNFQSVYKDAAEKRLVDWFMLKWQDKLALFGDESMAVRTYGLAAQADTIVVAEDMWWMRPGQLVLLSDRARRETRTIAQVSPGSLRFTEKNDTVFPTWTRIMPAYRGRIDQGQRTNRLTSAKGTIDVRVDIDPAERMFTDAQIADVNVPVIGLHEFLDAKHNWREAIDRQHIFPMELTDYGYGRVASFNPYAFPAQLNKLQFDQKTRDDVLTYVRFFLRQRGRNREFLTQTYEPDVPYYAAAAGSFSLLVEGTAFGLAYLDTTVFRRVLIRTKAGDYIHRQVDYIEVLPDTNTSVVWLTEALPNDVNVAPNQIVMCSWVPVSRFASDRLEVEWLTNHVAQFSMSIQTLENFDL